MKICAQGKNLETARWVADDYAPQEGESLFDPGAASAVLAIIRREAQAKVIALTGSDAQVNNAAAWVPKQLNPIMEFCGILFNVLKRQFPNEDWTRADQLAQMKTVVDIVRARSNLMESQWLAGVDVNAIAGSINDEGNWLTPPPNP